MKRAILINSLLILLLLPAAASAKTDTLALSVTPPLMNINLSKKQEVATSIRVINNNSRPITVYIEVADFRDQGDGQIEFLDDEAIKDDPGAKNMYLSRWITLTKSELVLEPFRGEEVPFVISVPEEANPGGHYAALLIGTKPPDEPIEGSSIKISSKISSLILARVAGEINEKGMIREFSPHERLSGGKENAFSVRFENLGNIHLRPQGVIKVYDMFGKAKGGTIEFNANKDFGNVLPGGDREWRDLAWRDDDFFLFNRYKAELSLSFGEETRQTDTMYVYFWAVNWKWLAISISILVAFLLLLLAVVKVYVRQSVKNLQREMGVGRAPFKRTVRKRVAAKTGTVDLRKKK